MNGENPNNLTGVQQNSVPPVEPQSIGSINQQIQPNQPVQTPLENKSKSKKGLGIIVAIILVGVLAFAGVCIYKKLTANPAAIFQNIISKSFSELKSELKDDEDFISIYEMNKPFIENGSIKLTTNLSELKKLNGETIKYFFGVDPKSNKAKINLSLNENSKEIIDATGYFQDKKIYAESSKLYDSIVYFMDLNYTIQGNDINDLYQLIDLLENVLKNSFYKENWKTQKTSLELDSKKVRVTENYFEINKVNYSEFLTRMINTILDDEKSIEILSKYIGVSDIEIKDFLKEGLDTSNIIEEENIRLSFYTKGSLNEVVGTKLVINNQEVLSAYEYSDYTLVNINLGEYQIEIKELSDEKSTFNIKSNGFVILGGTIENDDDTLSVKIDIEDFAITISIESKDSLNKIQTNAVVRIENSSEYIQLDMSSTFENNESFDTFNASEKNVKQYTEISETELSQIFNKLSELLQDSNIYSMLSVIDSYL